MSKKNKKFKELYEAERERADQAQRQLQQVSQAKLFLLIKMKLLGLFSFLKIKNSDIKNSFKIKNSKLKMNFFSESCILHFKSCIYFITNDPITGSSCMLTVFLEFHTTIVPPSMPPVGYKTSWYFPS